MKAKWSVLAVYENAEARQLAMQFCDGLVQRFWSDFGFDLSWCEWTRLEGPDSAKEEGSKVRASDLMIVASCSKGVLPSHVKTWLELALRERGDREGVMVGLPCPESGLTAEAAATQVYLRKLAHGSGMDYFNAVPQTMPARVPDSADACNQRATQMTSLLHGILRYSPLPPRAP